MMKMSFTILAVGCGLALAGCDVHGQSSSPSTCLKDGSVSLQRTQHIPDDVWAKLMQARAQIIDGSIKVEKITDAAGLHALLAR